MVEGVAPGFEPLRKRVPPSDKKPRFRGVLRKEGAPRLLLALVYTSSDLASLLATIAASQKKVVERGYNYLNGYEIGVTIAVTPILSLGFCGAKSDARYRCGQ